MHRLAALTTLLLACPSLSVAQEEPPDVRGFVELRAGVTRIRGTSGATIGGAAGLHLRPSWTLGGEGHFLPSAAAVGRVGFQELELLLGYGGVTVEWSAPASPDRPSWFARLLVGAGNADIEDADTGIMVESDNFVVVEPSAGLRHPLVGLLRASVEVSYRVVGGVEDLSGVDPSDLRGFGVRIGLRLSPL